MNKKNIIFIVILIAVCLVLSLSLYSIKLNKDTSCNEKDNIIVDSNQNAISFDVSDFSGTEINTIDIPSKVYDTNVISIRDTNFTISEELSNKIYDAINSYGASSSFYVVSLKDGMSFGYNVDKQYETASCIKAPYALYIYQEIAKGNINGEQKLTYESRFYNKGTGVIKNSPFGTQYTIKELVYYSLYESDNVAHTMLHRTFGVKGYNQMLTNLRTNAQKLTVSNPWGFTTVRSSAIIWQEIYNFAIRDDEGIEFLNILSNGKYNYYKQVMPSLPSASKSGFANRDVIETGIVFDDYPYILIAVANKGGNLGAYTQVLKLISLINEVMNEYKVYNQNQGI